MTMLRLAFSLILCFLALPCVSAHGYLAYLGIDDDQSYTNYTGNVPNADPSPSVIRQVLIFTTLSSILLYSQLFIGL